MRSPAFGGDGRDALIRSDMPGGDPFGHARPGAVAGPTVTGAVTVAVINFNGARHIERCLRSVLDQKVGPLELLVLDNGSTDDSLMIAAQTAPGARIVPLGANLGFAGAANEAIRRTTSPYVLLLNPDASLDPGYVEAVYVAAEGNARIGSVTGKLLRTLEAEGRPVIDSTGHILFRNRWVVNRGEGETDDGQYDAPGEVFGISGAAGLYRRRMLEDVKVGAEYFDETFFLYLEDVDLDWRAQLRGWTAHYAAAAVAHHERGHREKRQRRDARVLRHSLKNRYLMLLRNDRLADVLRDLPAILGLDLLRSLDYLFTQPRALRGYLDVAALIPHVLAERRAIQARRTVPPARMRRWLTASPYGRRLGARLLTRWRGSRP